jgi:cytochrome d ubiquinol oxidase subunit I
MEWHFDTQPNAPLVLGGVLTEDHQIKYGLKIPYALSILAHANPSAVVTGLNDIPDDEEPPLFIHYLFDIKMAFVGLMTLIVAAFMVTVWFGRRFSSDNRWLLRFIVLAAPVAMLTIEHGWIFAEVGRQPWILHGVMRTSEGATVSEHVDLMLYVFAGLYIVLGFTAVRVLTRMFKNNHAEDELIAMGIDGGDGV